MRNEYCIYFDDFAFSNCINHICKSYFYNSFFDYESNSVFLKNILKLYKKLVKYLISVHYQKYSFKKNIFKCKLFKKIKVIEEIEESE